MSIPPGLRADHRGAGGTLLQLSRPMALLERLMGWRRAPQGSKTNRLAVNGEPVTGPPPAGTFSHGSPLVPRMRNRSPTRNSGPGKPAVFSIQKTLAD